MSGELSALVTVVAVILLVAMPANGYVFWKTAVAAAKRPYITSLTLAALGRGTVFLASMVFAILGAASIYSLHHPGERLLPVPVPTLLIAFGALVISVPAPFHLRALQRWSSEADEWREHVTREVIAEALVVKGNDLEEIKQLVKDGTQVAAKAYDAANHTKERFDVVTDAIAAQGLIQAAQGDEMAAQRKDTAVANAGLAAVAETTAEEVHDLHEGTAPEKAS